MNRGRIDVTRLRRALAGVPLPRANGRLALAVDVSPWLRPDADTCSDRSFCHTFGRGLGKHQMVPGWPYSIVAAAASPPNECEPTRPTRNLYANRVVNTAFVALSHFRW